MKCVITSNSKILLTDYKYKLYFIKVDLKELISSVMFFPTNLELVDATWDDFKFLRNLKLLL